LKLANETKAKAAAETAQNKLNAMLLFQSDMGAFLRLYTYLSPIFDDGYTEIEKCSIFYRQVLRLSEFGREREGIDLSKVVLNHHTLKQRAANNTQEQFANSPDLSTEMMNAIINALDAHKSMSSQALASKAIREGQREILLGPAKLYEHLRDTS
jgi:hypothetical protein